MSSAMKPIHVALASILYFHSWASGQSSNRTCYWYGLQVGSIRGALYVTGGRRIDSSWDGTSMNHKASDLTLLSTATTLFVTNYSRHFDLEQGPPNLDMLFDKMPLGVSTQDMPVYVDGAVLTSDLELYNYGGSGVSKPMPDEIINFWAYPQEGQTPFEKGAQTGYKIPQGSSVSNAIVLGSSASVPVKDQRQAFYFSGMRMPNSDPLLTASSEQWVPANSLILADFSAIGDASWHNITLPTEVRPRARSQIVWVPRGSQGILIALGGVPYPPDLYSNMTTAQEDANKEAGSSFMRTVSVFDIETKNWYQQNTTGDTPDQLEGFCAVLAYEDDLDHTTFEIFIYGGTRGLVTPGGSVPPTDEVHVLSMPSFTWLKVHAGYNSHARTRHACTMPFPDQMLVIGGWPSTDTCIEDLSMLDVFNLNNLKWTRKFEPGKYEPYRTPEVVTQRLKGPGAPLTEAVSNLFETPYSKPIDNYYTTAQKTSKGENRRAIIGGSVTGAVLVVLMIVAFWYCLRALRQARADRGSIITTSSGGAVTRWLRGTHQPALPPKSVISDATTEVDPSMVFPKPPAELDSRTRAESMGTVPQAELEEASFSTTLHPSGAYSFARPLRSRSHSPGSLQATSVEAAGAPVHEVHGESKDLPPAPTLEPADRQGPTYLTDHHMYPWNVNWNPTAPQARQKAAAASESSLQRSPSAVTAPSGPSSRNSQLTSDPSPVDEARQASQVGCLSHPSNQPSSAGAASIPHQPLQNDTNAADAHLAGHGNSAPDLTQTTAVASGLSKRDSAVSPLLLQQNPQARNRTHVSSISSTVSAMDDLPPSVVSTQRPRGATVDSLAHVMQKDADMVDEAQHVRNTSKTGDGEHS